jgi:hypothetical protein
MAFNSRHLFPRLIALIFRRTGVLDVLRVNDAETCLLFPVLIIMRHACNFFKTLSRMLVSPLSFLPHRRIGRGWQATVGEKTGEKYPHYERELENLLDSSVIGDPEEILRHVRKSTGKLSDTLKAEGIAASPETVRTTRKRLGYKMRDNRKVNSSGTDHPDREAQFQHIKRLTKKAVKNKNQVISVDTKKKEAPGAYKNGEKSGARREKAPRWPIIILFLPMRPRLSLCDSGGSNGSRRRQWKYELHRLSNEIGIPIRVCHYPPGTSGWNKIKHCLFPFISMNWRGVPLTDYQTIVDLIRNTRTRTDIVSNANQTLTT